MCGIFACCIDDAGKVAREGIKSLEYRGYDSWGITVLNTVEEREDSSFTTYKQVGKVSQGEALLPRSSRAIAHTRWATHGKVTRVNAHPHHSSDGKVAVVHNGIIENYQELRAKLEKEGHTFHSQTDTEIIPNLIAEYQKSLSPKDAMRKALQECVGTFAVVVLFEDGSMGAAKRGSPLLIGMNKENNEIMLASDVLALSGRAEDMAILDDNQSLFIGSGELLLESIEYTNIATNKTFELSWEKIPESLGDADKGVYKHYMVKEIFEQPTVLRKVLQEYCGEGTINFDLPKEWNKIIIVACGTSYYAGFVGKYVIEELARIPVEIDYASEFRYRDPLVDDKTLVIPITQSGETADTLAAVEEAKKKGAKILAIANVTHSSIARLADVVIGCHAGPEIGVASTKAFTTQSLVLYCIALKMAQEKRTLSEEKIKYYLDEMRKIPLLVEEILGSNEYIFKVAKQYMHHSNFLYLGRGANYPIALEGALKLKEISYIHAEGQSAAEMKHGPIALIDINMPTVFLAVKDKTYAKVMSNIEEVCARGGKVIAIASDEEMTELASDVITIPKVDEVLYPLLTVIPLQLLAYHIADLRECDIDQPKNLAKSVTVE